MSERLQTRAVARFTCLGDACEDTCCQGWGMQLTQETIDLYTREAPSLLEAVSSGEAEYVMKRDPETDYCVKFDQGWCGIHRAHGSDFLGDACHFFPRITRAIGDTVLTTAALSCPESARLMLMEAGGFTREPRAEARLPFSLKQYLNEGASTEQMLAIHDRFLAEMENPEFTPEVNFMRLSAVARALETQPLAQWLDASAFYFKIAATRVPTTEAAATDPFNLVHALHGLIGASKVGKRPRLAQTASMIYDALGMSFLDNQVMLTNDAAERFLAMQHAWKQVQESMQPILQRYVQAQLSIGFFPYAGLGNTLSERITIIGVRFATVKLALMAAVKEQGGMPVEGTIICVVQSLSRFLDHLADPTLSLQIYHEAGWVREARLRNLLMESLG